MRGYKTVRDLINHLRDERGLKIDEIAFDPWNAVQLAQDLMADGFELVETRQGYRTLSEPTKELQSALVQGSVRHGGHPVLRWMADCMTVKQDENGNVRPVKPERLKSSKRIDGIVAMIMAMSRAIVNGHGKSVYEWRGLLIIGWTGCTDSDLCSAFGLAAWCGGDLRERPTDEGRSYKGLIRGKLLRLSSPSRMCRSQSQIQARPYW